MVLDDGSDDDGAALGRREAGSECHKKRKVDWNRGEQLHDNSAGRNQRESPPTRESKKRKIDAVDLSQGERGCDEEGREVRGVLGGFDEMVGDAVGEGGMGEGDRSVTGIEGPGREGCDGGGLGDSEEENGVVSMKALLTRLAGAAHGQDDDDDDDNSETSLDSITLREDLCKIASEKTFYKRRKAKKCKIKKRKEAEAIAAESKYAASFNRLADIMERYYNSLEASKAPAKDHTSQKLAEPARKTSSGLRQVSGMGAWQKAAARAEKQREKGDGIESFRAGWKEHEKEKKKNAKEEAEKEIVRREAERKEADRTEAERTEAGRKEAEKKEAERKKAEVLKEIERVKERNRAIEEQNKAMKREMTWRRESLAAVKKSYKNQHGKRFWEEHQRRQKERMRQEEAWREEQGRVQEQSRVQEPATDDNSARSSTGPPWKIYQGPGMTYMQPPRVHTPYEQYLDEMFRNAHQSIAFPHR